MVARCNQAPNRGLQHVVCALFQNTVRARLTGVASPDQHRRLLSSTIAAVLALLAALLGLALALAPRADAYVYWTAPGTPSGPTIGRANLDGTGMNQSFISGVGPPLAIAVDAGHIYWENDDTNTIGRANLDGTGVNKNFIGGYTFGIAVDADHIYWAETAAPIGRANLDGTDVDENFIGGVFPLGIAVDAGHLYWTDIYPGAIGRANLDGTGVDPSFIGGLRNPTGIAVDAAHLYWRNNAYWPNFDPNTIGRANLDGTGVNQSLVVTGGTPPTGDLSFGIAVDAGHLYWADYTERLAAPTSTAAALTKPSSSRRRPDRRRGRRPRSGGLPRSQPRVQSTASAAFREPPRSRSSSTSRWTRPRSKLPSPSSGQATASR